MRLKTTLLLSVALGLQRLSGNFRCSARDVTAFTQIIMKVKIILAATPLVWILLGCASSGRHEQALVFTPRQSAVIAWEESSFPGRYAPALAAVLEKNGLIVATNGTPGALVCKTSLRGGVTMTARIVLLSEDKPLVTADASNAGVGTVIARGAAKDNIINSALDAFDQELSKARRGEP